MERCAHLLATISHLYGYCDFLYFTYRRCISNRLVITSIDYNRGFLHNACNAKLYCGYITCKCKRYYFIRKVTTKKKLAQLAEHPYISGGLGVQITYFFVIIHLNMLF